MDGPKNGGWPPGAPGPPPNADGASRNLHAYGPGPSLPQVPAMQMQAPNARPGQPQGHFYTQPGSNTLPAIGGLTQSSPRQTSHVANHPRLSPPPMHHQAQALPPPPGQPGPGYQLPALGPPMPQPSLSERERQYHEAEAREYEERERERQHMAEREYREQRHRMGEPQQRTPPNAHVGAVPLQQPIASRTPAILHGPNGLLNANASMNPQPGPPSGAPAMFANGVPPHEAGPRPYPPSGPSGPPQHLPVANGAAPQPAMTTSALGLPQGQQPILNDALTYLDLVKVRFQDQPDVYNKFLDIMKDFKSQAIDTPGVIERVSGLFNGHPMLIQGFNTFLPPGYKIEAGLDNDPNTIRVTTPMGTTTCRPSMITAGQLGAQLNGNRPDGGHLVAPPPHEPYRPQEAEWRGHPSEDPAAINAHGRPGMVALYGPRDEEMAAAEASALAHHQEQRGVSQLQNAVNVAVDTQAGRMPPMQGGLETAAGAAANGVAGMAGPGQPNLERRGPVEFNHAINYVNKIKLRFASQPEVYKQFLEILQTYQRESKPIGEVYAQVTQLFITAPDLLEDFQQFLPETAAHAKSHQQAVAMRAANDETTPTSNLRGEASYIAGIPGMSQTPKSDKMPPLGNFAPPSSVTKDGKKRRAGPGAAPAGSLSMTAAQDPAASRGALSNLHASKRQKIAGKPSLSELPLVSPSLVPELPRPLPPTQAVSNVEEIAFFDRVKKYVANKQSFNEFLKLCNLFTQDLIDVNTLVAKAEGFIGQNADLMNYFRRFVRWTGQDTVVENRPAPSNTKVVLSNCRALGPSYRLLPKRERFAKCSGRDEMCHEVLNDEWASHPTWASEDSGFMSHRKNAYEEALYRMEEERHDYDFNIETCKRTLQLLEPIVAQINAMDPEDRQVYKLPRGLGGQSEAIWQRIIKKLYDRPTGCLVIKDMFEKPTKICPVIYTRLREKLEKWKQAQREWEKIWREQTMKQFWKSLDHQGLNAKAENKRAFQPKALQTDIQAKFEEQKRQKQIRPLANPPKYQLEMAFEDTTVVEDTCHMLLTYLRTTYQGADQAKIEAFLRTFIPTFFGLDRERFDTRMADVYSEPPSNDDDEDTTPTGETAGRGRRAANGKKTLLRGVLDPRKDGRRDSHHDSKESTPDVMSMEEDSSTQTEPQDDKAAALEPPESRWMELSVTGPARERLQNKYNEPFSRTHYSLYANLHTYCFMRMFGMLYERLSNVKGNEEGVREDIRRSMMHKPAMDLRIADRSPSDFFDDTSPTANYYQQIVRMCEGCLEHNVEMVRVEDTLRRFYMSCGWQLYSFDKMLGAIVKFASQVIVNDAKERSYDIINLFLANRKEPQTTHQAEIDYRKQSEKLAKDSDMYRIVYNTATARATIQIFRKDDTTFDTSRGTSPAFLWSYYVTAYAQRDWTEGVAPASLYWPFLRRNLPSDLHSEEDYARAFLPMNGSDSLVVRIAPTNYRLSWEQGTADWWVHDDRTRARGARRDGLAQARDARNAAFVSKFLEPPRWQGSKSEDAVAKIMRSYEALLEGTEDAVTTSVMAETTGDDAPNDESKATAVSANDKPDEEMKDQDPDLNVEGDKSAAAVVSQDKPDASGVEASGADAKETEAANEDRTGTAAKDSADVEQDDKAATTRNEDEGDGVKESKTEESDTKDEEGDAAMAEAS